MQKMLKLLVDTNEIIQMTEGNILLVMFFKGNVERKNRQDELKTCQIMLKTCFIQDAWM